MSYNTHFAKEKNKFINDLLGFTHKFTMINQL